ncbi:MAG: hypothetical protein ACI9JE_001612, partial [Candidatus Krumholzibacteriia bacterium]
MVNWPDRMNVRGYLLALLVMCLVVNTALAGDL